MKSKTYAIALLSLCALHSVIADDLDTSTSAVRFIATGYTAPWLQPLSPQIIQSLDGGKHWSMANLASPAVGNLGSASCNGRDKNAMCIAVGSALDDSAAPLVEQSLDGGETWTAPTITNSHPGESFSASSCAGVGHNAFCVAAGEDYSNGMDTPIPLLAQSKGGDGWTIPSIQGLPALGDFFSASCTGSGHEALCIAVGENKATDDAQPIPLLVQNKGGDTTWSTPTVANLPAHTDFYSASCTGTGHKALCIAAGEDTQTSQPVLAQTTNGGSTWAMQTIPQLARNGKLTATSCTGEGKNAICVATGVDKTDPSNHTPFLIQTVDGGATWALQTISDLPINSRFKSINCTGSAKKAFCVAVGAVNENNINAHITPFLIHTLPGSMDWKMTPISEDRAAFYSVHCTGTGFNASCVAVGNAHLNSKNGVGMMPFIAYSNDGAVSWQLPSSLNAPQGNYWVGSAATGGQ